MRSPSLRSRLALLTTAIIAVMFAAGSVATYLVVRQQQRNEVDRFLAQRAVLVRTGGGSAFDRDDVRFGPGAPGGDRPRGAASALFTPDAIAQLLSSAGGIVKVRDQPQLPVAPSDLAAAGATGAPSIALRDVTVAGVEYRMLTTSLGNGTAVQVARDLTESNTVLAALRNRLLVIAFVGTVLASAAAWMVTRRTTAPVRRLAAAAEHVAVTQDLSTSLPQGGPEEVARLGRSFDTMLTALASSREQQQRLVMDASHELRTPLTSLRTNIELLHRAPDLPSEQRRELVDDANAELVELSDLVNQLVALATEGPADEALSPVDLVEVADQVAERARRRTSRPVDVVTTGPTVVVVRPGQIERVVSNLVDNALKYSPPDAAVQVEVGGGGGHAKLVVHDHGRGIPAEDRTRVFDRVYRGASTRASVTGSGLGLAIVRQVVEAHGGSVTLGDEPGGGATVGFTLPLALA